MEIPLQFRRDTLANWESEDPVLLEGEVGLVLGNDELTQLKFGDGTRSWSELPWAARGPRGFDFQFSWDGYRLGVKHSDQSTYSYVDLRGARGANFEYEWSGTSLGVKTSDDAEFVHTGLGLEFSWDGYSLGVKRQEDSEYNYVDLRGANFEYSWDGYSLGVKTSDDAEYTYVDLRGARGANFEFNWDGYSLGVKTSDDAEFVYTDLRGARGANFEYVWDGTTLKVKTSDDAEYVGVDLKGEKGDCPAHTWIGTSLSFENVDGSYGDPVDLKGETGEPGILSEGKIWIGNAEGNAEEQDFPEPEEMIADNIVGLNARIRQYVTMYSQLMQQSSDWATWDRIVDKPEEFPPSTHSHSFSGLGFLDYESDVLINKPIVAPLNHNHVVLSHGQRRQASRRGYMYGGL